MLDSDGRETRGPSQAGPETALGVAPLVPFRRVFRFPSEHGGSRGSRREKLA